MTHTNHSLSFQQWSIDFWLDAGIPKDRLVVGIPTYGMTFRLADPKQHGVFAPAIGGGTKGEYTGERGIMSYYEVGGRGDNECMPHMLRRIIYC